MTAVPEIAANSLETRTEPSGKRVLIAEDDPMFRRILQSWLQSWSYRVSIAEDGAQAWSILLQEHPPELLILDWVMPEVDGLELCRRIRERHQSPYQYILLVTGKDEKQDIVRGLDTGADDYLTKPFDRDELQARLRVGQRILKLQQDLIDAREELRFQAMHDALTGLWNRRALLELMHRELERAARAAAPTWVLMLDLDHFKSINDTFGHLAGDAVLREVASRIAQNVRPYDLAGRYGGEEFLVVLSNCGEAEAAQTAERIRLAIATAPIFAAGSMIPVTVSIGVTGIGAGARSDQEGLLVADKALYQAKDGGRNRVCIL